MATIHCSKSLRFVCRSSNDHLAQYSGTYVTSDTIIALSILFYLKRTPKDGIMGP